MQITSSSLFWCRFKFPSIIPLYQSTAILAISALDLLRYAPGNELVCKSKDLIESLEVENSTAFCKFLGKYRDIIILHIST